MFIYLYICLYQIFLSDLDHFSEFQLHVKYTDLVGGFPASVLLTFWFGNVCCQGCPPHLACLTASLPSQVSTTPSSIVIVKNVSRNGHLSPRE